MKNLIIRWIEYLEQIRDNHPKSYKILYYSLFVIAPIEMLAFKFGVLGYKKLKQYSKANLEKLR